MAAVLNSFVRLRNPSTSACPPLPLPFHPLRHSKLVSSTRPPHPARTLAFLQTHPRSSSVCSTSCPLLLPRGGRFIVCSAASHEDSKHSEIDVEKTKSDYDLQADKSLEEWQKTLESFKEQALKMQAMSQEAYDVYSKKAGIILKETSEKLKVQAKQARLELTDIAKEISEESKEHLSTMLENSPESVKDIVETFSSSTSELKQSSHVRDFHVGIPYGILLFVGGFLSFMLTGSIAAIRFGVILGGALLALGILNMRLWKQGQSSSFYLRGQGAIAAIIFLRELRYFSFTVGTLLNTCVTFVSGAVAVFYLLKIIPKSFLSDSAPESEQSSES